MRRALTAGMLSGLMLALTHAATPWLGPFAAAPLLWAVRRSSAREAFWAGLLAGVGEAAVLAGVMHSGWRLVLGVVLFIGCTRALFALSLWLLHGGRGVWGPPCAGAAWAVWEVVAAHVPFTLPALLGDTQHTGPWLQVARIGGTYLVSALLVWAAAVMAAGYDYAKQGTTPGTSWRLWGAQALAFVLLVAGLQGGAHAVLPERGPTVKTAVIQGGLPTWYYQKAEDTPPTVPPPEVVYAELTTRAGVAALTVWPETAVWRFWGSDQAWMQELARTAATRGGLLVGTPRRDAGGGLYNSAVLLGDGAPRFVDKVRLALRAEAAFTPGVSHGPLTWQNTPLGILFCLETVVPEYAREQVRRGAQILVALVEGSRFGATPVGRMHAQRSRLRAVESGRAVVHAGQHGHSFVALPDGTATRALEPFTADTMVQDVPVYVGTTPYVALGLWSLSPLWTMLALAYAVRLWRWRQTSAKSAP